MQGSYVVVREQRVHVDLLLAVQLVQPLRHQSSQPRPCAPRQPQVEVAALEALALLHDLPHLLERRVEQREPYYIPHHSLNLRCSAQSPSCYSNSCPSRTGCPETEATSTPSPEPCRSPLQNTLTSTPLQESKSICTVRGWYSFEEVSSQNTSSFSFPTSFSIRPSGLIPCSHASCDQNE